MVGLNGERPRSARVRGIVRRGQDDDRQLSVSPGAEPFDHREPVHLGHLHIAHQDRGRCPGVGHLVQNLDRFARGHRAAHDRAGVLQDEINYSVTSTLNHHMYVLSIVAVIFLPLSLVTGLLGINVGGLPGVDSPIAFWVVCVVLLCLALAQVWFLRKKRML